MQRHLVRANERSSMPPRSERLTWKLAAVDNARVAIAVLAPGRVGELHLQVPSALLDVAGLTPGLFERHGH
ncbi:MAG: hypothetical protein ACYDB2_05705 [Acidimicrobiales bacterium]